MTKFPLTQSIIHDHHATECVTLTYDGGFLRRKVLTSDEGTRFLVDLEKTTSVNDGDAFLLDDGRHVGVRSAPEALLEITGDDLHRIAWHIGNRHTPCQIEPSRLLIQCNHVMQDMLKRIGAKTRQVSEPFTPEEGPMGTGARMATHTDLLTLSQWLSPAYPLGSFSYSPGLETAIAIGAVRDMDSLQDWLADVLHHGAGQADARFLAAAHGSQTDAELLKVDALCRAFAPSAERLKESDLQGAAFCEVTNAVWHIALPRLAFPVAVGRAAGWLELPLAPTLELFVQAFLSNLVGAAQRLMPLGQTKSQKIIHAFAPLCQAIANSAQNGDLDRLTSTAFLADIASMHHETQQARIFRT